MERIFWKQSKNNRDRSKPKSKQLEKYGFDIFIGNQADLNFWKKFYEKVGKIDILLDDGGHDNDQQIITLTESIPYINNGGIIVTEDTHASYLKKHGIHQCTHL